MLNDVYIGYLFHGPLGKRWSLDNKAALLVGQSNWLRGWEKKSSAISRNLIGPWFFGVLEINL